MDAGRPKAAMVLSLLESIVVYAIAATKADQVDATPEQIDAFVNAERRMVSRVRALGQSSFNDQDLQRLLKRHRDAIEAATAYVKCIGIQPYPTITPQETHSIRISLSQAESRLRKSAQTIYRHGVMASRKSQDRVTRKPKKPPTET